MRKSSRINQGQLPKYLEDFEVNISMNSDSSNAQIQLGRNSLYSSAEELSNMEQMHSNLSTSGTEEIIQLKSRLMELEKIMNEKERIIEELSHRTIDQQAGNIAQNQIPTNTSTNMPAMSSLNTSSQSFLPLTNSLPTTLQSSTSSSSQTTINNLPMTQFNMLNPHLALSNNQTRNQFPYNQHNIYQPSYSQTPICSLLNSQPSVQSYVTNPLCQPPLIHSLDSSSQPQSYISSLHAPPVSTSCATTISGASVYPHLSYNRNSVPSYNLNNASSTAMNHNFNTTTDNPSGSLGYDFRRKLYDLPEFNGKPEEWPVFFTTFNESNAAFNYSHLENIFRLQKALKGEAKETVESLLIHPNNIPQIIAQLEFRFGRPDCLIRSQIMKVKGILPISESRVDQIIPFATKVQNLAVFLETTNSFQHLANPTLMDELISKLPISKRLEWAQYSIQIKPYATILQFSSWLNQLSQLISLVNLPNINVRQDISSIDRTKRAKGMLLYTKEQPRSLNVKSACNYCGKQNHNIINCFSFQRLSIVDRWEAVKSKHLCFSCLSKDHNVRTCKAKKSCQKDNCKRTHHPLLHELNPSENNTEVVNESSQSQSNSEPVLSCKSQEGDRKLLFRVIPVKLYGPASEIETYAFFDEGSSVTILDEDVASKLGLVGENIELNLQWIGNKTTTEKSSSVNLQISGIKNNHERFDLKKVRTMKGLALPSQTLNLKQLHTKYHSYRNLPISEFTSAIPKILIGIDNVHLGLPDHVIKQSVLDPIVAKTKLGWVVYGPLYSNRFDMNSKVVLCCHEVKHDDELHEVVKEYFSTENFGVKMPVKTLQSMEDTRANKLLFETTKRVGDRFETGLLWKMDHVVLPNSYYMALNRLTSIEKKMLKSPAYAELYEKNLMDYVTKGYARKLSPHETKVVTDHTWYLPHFGVQNPNKPNKLRIVFDAAASVNGVSLNTMLLKGPDQYKALPTILFQFREGEIAVVGDIKEMFSQIKIRPEDENSQRFLWRHCELSKPVETYVMTSMTFGATCSPCSAQYVKNTNAMEYIKKYPKAVSAIINNHYVDDYVQSFQNEEEAIEVSSAVKSLHRKASFELTTFASNSQKVLEVLNDGEVVQESNCLNMEVDNAADKILGMYWNITCDEFVFHLKFHKIDKEVLKGKRRPTKRQMLAIVMSIFDPFGFLADYLIYSKLLLQELWKVGTNWDEQLPDEINSKWLEWYEGLQSIKNFRISRCYSLLLPNANTVELHVFVDASEQAFAAVAYFRIKKDDKIEIVFVMGKTKCAPQKLLSIPRLELQAAVLGTRLKTTIEKSHNIKMNKCIFWCDSKTVISWIKSDHRSYKPFVGHRISEILESCEINDWMWVPSKMNPADKATRVKLHPYFDNNNVWLKGPQFLLDDINYKEVFPCNIEKNCDDELRRSYVGHVAHSKIQLINLSRFSSYIRLKRTIAWVYRFINNSNVKKTTFCRKINELCAAEIEKADLFLCKIAQSEVYYNEISFLNESKEIPKTSTIVKLTPILDKNGVLRLGGRINNAACVSEETKHPIILPKDHLLTKLIVSYYHKQFHHQNNETIICEIRKRYWIINLRSAVESTKKHCQRCKNNQVKPRVPLMGQLPIDRLTPYIRPFTYTGLDYFGPCMVTIGRRREKRWVALFTCLTIRAVHLELASNLSADACILAIRNFINLRGNPLRIRSDNGTNFIAADKELKDAYNLVETNKIQQELSSRGIEWLFNCPANPSAGGCWERLVQSVKRVLSYTLNEEAPQVETLRSLLLEAANIINCRPLTHVPVTSEDEEPLTPNHFLMGYSNLSDNLVDSEIPMNCLRKQWRLAQQMKNRFWKRWVREYLPTLTRRTKFFQKTDPIKIGDLVIICENDQSRGQWRRGRVVKVNIGSDGCIRTAEVKTSTGTLRRPVSKLAVLDVSNCGESLAIKSIHGEWNVAESKN